MDEHPVVVEVGNVIAAESAVAFLATNDIDAWVEGANMAAMHYPDKRSIKVRVAAADLDAARELILDTPLVMASREDQSEDMLAEPVNCPRCHSERIQQNSAVLNVPVLVLSILVVLFIVLYMGYAPNWSGIAGLIAFLVVINLVRVQRRGWTCKDCKHNWR